MSFLRQTLLVLLVLLSPALPALAQTAPPAPLSQQQFDALVDTLSTAVAERLKAGNASAPPAPAASEPKADTAKSATAHPKKPAAETPVSSEPVSGGTSPPLDPMQALEDKNAFSTVFIDVMSRTDDALAEFPEMLEQGARIPSILGPELNNGRSPGRFLLLLAACAIVTLGTEGALRLLLRHPRRYLAGRVEGTASLWALTALVSLDILILTGMWLVTHGLVVAFFHGLMPQERFGHLVLTSIFYWRLYLLAFRIALRPKLPQARLAEIGDNDATRIYRWASAVIAVAIILNDIQRILNGMQSSPLILACAVIVSTIVLTCLLVVAATAIREPMALWLHGLSHGGKPGPLVTRLARFWLIIAIPFFLALGIAHVYGALTTLMGVHLAVSKTMNVLIGLLILESFMDKVCRLMQTDKAGSSHFRERAVEALMRCVRVAILLGALSILFRIWAVTGIGMMDMNGYNALASAALPAGTILLGAYCAWQGVEYFTGRYAIKAGTGLPGHQDGDDANALQPATASRMSTLMPLLRVTLTLAIIIMASLTVMSQLGIDITPLIAGASIVGLAISFGSQTLVKDIVSGVFYLVDDAFRVGEYIDCGKAKGTVEGFTLRSLKLRHQNGMIHTIPFGQLGQVTNFSRDWSTLKFNLRFTRTTDLEKLRKTVKKIGLEMLEDPEYKDDFLMPLKMQGVADITDNALVVRFKFTVKPARPTVIQREAIKRMVRVLPEQGIEFANNMVPVQSMGGPGDQAAAGAAINRMKIANDLAEAAAAQ